MTGHIIGTLYSHCFVGATSAFPELSKTLFDGLEPRQVGSVIVVVVLNDVPAFPHTRVTVPAGIVGSVFHAGNVVGVEVFEPEMISFVH